MNTLTTDINMSAIQTKKFFNESIALLDDILTDLDKWCVYNVDLYSAEIYNLIQAKDRLKRAIRDNEARIQLQKAVEPFQKQTVDKPKKRVCLKHPRSIWGEGYPKCYWGFKFNETCEELLEEGGEKYDK